MWGTGSEGSRPRYVPSELARAGRQRYGPSRARAHASRCGGHVTWRAVTNGSRPPTRSAGPGPELPGPGTPAWIDRPGPGARSEEAARRGHVPRPRHGALAERSGVGPDREGLEKRRDLTLQGSVQRAKHIKVGQASQQCTQLTGLKRNAPCTCTSVNRPAWSHFVAQGWKGFAGYCSHGPGPCDATAEARPSKLDRGLPVLEPEPPWLPP
jgi:hypothetical protein